MSKILFFKWIIEVVENNQVKLILVKLESSVTIVAAESSLENVTVWRQVKSELAESDADRFTIGFTQSPSL